MYITGHLALCKRNLSILSQVYQHIAPQPPHHPEALPTLPNIPQVPIVDIDISLQQWNCICQEMITEFNIPESLAQRLQNYVAKVCTVSSLQVFLHACHGKMTQPGPERFIAGAVEFLNKQAAFLLSNVPPNVKTAMVAFNISLEFDTNFTIRNELSNLVTELKTLILFTWGSDSVKDFVDEFDPWSVPKYLHNLVCQPTINNFTAYPVLCNYTVYRLFNIKQSATSSQELTIKLRGHWALSSTASGILYILRLGCLCYAATFDGIHRLTNQLLMCR